MPWYMIVVWCYSALLGVSLVGLIRSHRAVLRSRRRLAEAKRDEAACELNKSIEDGQLLRQLADRCYWLYLQGCYEEAEQVFQHIMLHYGGRDDNRAQSSEEIG